MVVAGIEKYGQTRRRWRQQRFPIYTPPIYNQPLSQPYFCPSFLIG